MASAVVPAVGICDLPDEILVEIFSYLPLLDTARSAHVCDKWRSLLRREKELWRRKEWSSGSVGATRELLVAGGGIPRLRCLQLLYDSEYKIHVAWPDVTVRLYFGTPFLWEPYFRSFETESLVVSQLVAENISGYIECVDTRTLRRICVAEQHLEYPRPRNWPYFAFVPTCPYYSHPILSYRCATMLHSADWCYRQDGPGSDGDSDSRRSSFSDVSQPEDGVPEVEAEDEADGCAACPALEVLNVHCKRLSQQRLCELCSLGPLRVLRVESRGLGDLSLLRSLGSRLEELVLADCGALAAEEFSELRGLARLRVLRLGRCRLDRTALRDVAVDLPHLQTLSLNGEELLECSQ